MNYIKIVGFGISTNQEQQNNQPKLGNTSIGCDDGMGTLGRGKAVLVIIGYPPIEHSYGKLSFSR